MATIALRNSPRWNCHLRLQPQAKRETLPQQHGKAAGRAKDGNESPQDGVTVLADQGLPACPVPSEQADLLIQQRSRRSLRDLCGQT
jgi:hypothetical protein